MRCILHLVIAISTTILASSSTAQTVLFADGFESGFGNWTSVGLWNGEAVTDTCGSLAAPFPEGSSAAYYGLDSACDYDTGSVPNLGFLLLVNSVALPAGGPGASFTCWTWHRTEPCTPSFMFLDMFRLFLSVDGGSWASIAVSCQPPLIGPMGTWSLRYVDLTPYVGHSVSVGFGFDTGDNQWNDFTGAFVDQVEIRLEAGQPFCATTCPCAGPANIPALHYGAASGCTSSVDREGELIASGTPSVSSDDVVLTARELPATTVVLFAQSAASHAGVTFGDGTLCLGDAVMRLAARLATNGAAALGLPGDVRVSLAGQLPPGGGTRHYQGIYRDSATYCASSFFNATNGFTIAWTP